MDSTQYTPQKRKGHTKGQIILIPLQPPEGPQDLLHTFLLVVAAAYCCYLDPEVEDGTVASSAVLGFLTEKRVKTKLLLQCKTRMHRLVHRGMISSCAQGLNEWVREGTYTHIVL